MSESSFNLIDVMATLQSRKKSIIAFVTVAVVAATITVFLLPKYYRSIAIVVAANPALADKARLFNPNIEGLYSNYGSSDDLDRIYGMANLDTVYKQLIHEFDLINYYKLSGTDSALLVRKAILELREDLTLQKTELYQLKIFVYTKDKTLSAQMANRTVDIVQQMAQQVWMKHYANSLTTLTAEIKTFESTVRQITDSLNQPTISTADAAILTNKKNMLLQQLNEYQKSANEFALAIQNNPPALIVLEKAYPSAKADKPKKLVVIAWAFFLSLIFASIAALLYKPKSI
jgi:uncharacterized protein involved in exopolysaccharide biosynthesis